MDLTGGDDGRTLDHDVHRLILLLFAHEWPD